LEELFDERLPDFFESYDALARPALAKTLVEEPPLDEGALLIASVGVCFSSL
jgi:hypothetical protein